LPQSIQIGKGKTGQGTTISELGRWKLAFGYGTHTVKVVREDQPDLLGTTLKGSVLDVDRYIGQSHSPDMACKLRVEFAGAHHELW